MMATELNQTPYLAERLNELREIIGNEYMDERARRRLTAWLETTQKAAALSVRVPEGDMARALGWVREIGMHDAPFHVAAIEEAIAAYDPERAGAQSGRVAEGRKAVLRSFAQAVMEDWHEGDLDGGYRQELAERFGLLRAIERFSPCGENCVCSEYFSDDDWKDGQHCYRMTTLLTGDPKSDAAIDAAQEAEREAASA